MPEWKQDKIVISNEARNLYLRGLSGRFFRWDLQVKQDKKEKYKKDRHWRTI